MVVRAAVLFAFALLFALVEIEIEGRHGWAEKLPTWFRTRPRYARIFGAVMGGKPLTGYHASMFLVAFASFHVPFVSGAPFGAIAELRALSTFFLWIVVWDLLWFVLNPTFGWRRFKKGAVWWHNRAWIAGLPIDYYKGLAVAFAFAACAGWPLVRDQAVLLAGFVALTAAASFAAPAYQRWYTAMRAPEDDDRERAGIFHADDR